MRVSTKAGLGIAAFAALGTAYVLTRGTTETQTGEEPVVERPAPDRIEYVHTVKIPDTGKDTFRIPESTIKKTDVEKYGGHVLEHYEDGVLRGTTANYDENFTRADHGRLQAIEAYMRKGIRSIHDLRELNDPNSPEYLGSPYMPHCSFADMQVYGPNGKRLEKRDLDYIMGKLTREAWEAGRGGTK